MNHSDQPLNERPLTHVNAWNEQDPGFVGEVTVLDDTPTLNWPPSTGRSPPMQLPTGHWTGRARNASDPGNRIASAAVPHRLPGHGPPLPDYRSDIGRRSAQVATHQFGLADLDRGAAH